MRSSAGLDSRRKMILYRAWHRGTKEMDLVLGGFVDAEIEQLTDPQLDELEQLMTASDPEGYKWLSGTKPVPAEWESPLVYRIRRFHGVADAS